MSSGSATLRLLADFAGAVTCESLRGGRDLRLAGLARDIASQRAQLLLSEVRLAPGASALPPALHQLTVWFSADSGVPGAGVSLQLTALEGVFVVGAHAVHLHRDASQAFFRAVPPPRVPLRTRAGWALLLTLLRLPPLYQRLIRSAG